MNRLFIGVCCLILASTAFAQSDRGTITGTVTDPASAVIPGAAIKAVSTETGAEYETVTTSTGNYTLAQLPAGLYNVEVSAPGFSKYTQQGIRIQVAQTARIDVGMKVGATVETVTVVSDAPLLKTESGEQSSNITTDQILNLPLYGGNGRTSGNGLRSPYAFLTTMSNASLMASGTNTGIRVNGLPTDTYSTRIEGQESTNTQQPNAGHINPGVEAMQEVTLQTSNFAAEFGQVGGGIINFTAKSGANKYHGSAFEYLRNEGLNAGRAYSDDGRGRHVRARARSNNYGFSISGPVAIPKVYDGHDKTFFFFNLETAPGTSTAVGQLTVPTPTLRTGNFSGLLTTRSVGTDLLGRPMIENTIYDPQSTQIVGGSVVRNPFAGNIIPTSRLDPVALKIQDRIPQPNRGAGVVTNNFQQNFFGKTGVKLYNMKVDHQLSSATKVAFYYSHKISNGWTQPDDLPIPLTATRRGRNDNPTLRLNVDHSVTPTFLVHAGVGWLRNLNPDPALNEVLAFDALKELGFYGGVPTDFSGTYATGFPRITGIGGNLGGGPNMGPVNANIYNSQKPTAVLSATWVKSNHTYKFGGEWRKDAHTDRNVRGSQGILNFGNAQTGQPTSTTSGGSVGYSYASFLLGLMSSATVSTPQDPQFLKISWGLFAQDSWKVSRRLSLEYGIRYDYQGALHELWDRIGAFGPDVANPSAGGLRGGMAYAGYGPGRCECQFSKAYPWGFQPRLGFAYQLDSKTVLRGGWGLSYAQTANYAYISNVPIVGVGAFNQFSFNPPGPGLAAATLRDGLPYKLEDLLRSSLDPGIRPNLGTLDSPPYWLDPNGGRPPRINQWSFSVQRELTRNLVAEASYVGNRGVWELATGLNDLNAVTPESLRTRGIDFSSATDRALMNQPLTNTNVINRGYRAPYATWPTSNTLLQSLRPFPQFSSIPVRWSPLGNTWYDSLQTKITKRYSNGLDMLAGFTWQKELSLGGDGGTYNDIFNRPNQKTISPNSVPFVFTLAATYMTPSAGSSRLMKFVTGGWMIGSILRYQSGTPMAIPGAQNNLAAQLGRGTVANRVPGEPLFLKDLNCHCFDPTQDLVLNPKAWSDPAAGQWGFSSPYYSDFRSARRPSEQFTFGRTFRLNESGASVEFQAMFFNAFNRTMLNSPTSNNALASTQRNPDGSLLSGYGFINTGSLAADPRDGVMSLRVQF